MSPFEEIKRQLDIVEVISEYLPLKRVGNSYATRCPFHPDRTPSFYVSPSRGIWKCFGCGKGGDVIKFVAEYENISYFEAAKLLAERYNLDIDFGDKEEGGRFYRALKLLNGFYQEQLVNSSHAREFLIKRRRFSPSVVSEYRLGFAGDGYKSVDFAKSEGIFEELLELKHFYRTSYGKYRDLFHERVTIPIKNPLGKIVAFGGRTILEGENIPKYKNSPNSPVFQKEKTLFGLDRAKTYAREKGKVILVEGYFDVIRLHSVGLGNTVAPLGTSVTLHHARVLSKLAPEVVLLFDGDSAGKRAAIESAKKLLKFPVEVSVVFLPPGEDPDTFVLKEGARALRELLSGARPLRERLLGAIVKAPPERKETYVNLYRELVREINDPLRASLWIKEFRDRTGAELFSRRGKISPIRKVEPPKGLSPHEVDFLLGLFYLNPPDIELENFDLSPEAKRIAEQILKGEGEEKLPKWLFEMDTLSLERRFQMAKEVLSVDKPLLEETFKTLHHLEEKIKRGQASGEDLEKYRRLLVALSEGEKRLYRLFKAKMVPSKGGEF